jgi:hypothetical protein
MTDASGSHDVPEPKRVIGMPNGYVCDMPAMWAIPGMFAMDVSCAMSRDAHSTAHAKSRTIVAPYEKW